jgi:hypothetical protein
MIYPPIIVDHMASLGKVMNDRRENQAIRQFSNMKADVERINPRSLMDIGSGFAIIDALIAKHVSVQQIHLIDGNGSISKNVGFKDNNKAWTDVNFGVEIVRANISSNIQVLGHFADPDAINVRADLIISCRSWGHHFPISLYSETVRRCLNPGGFVITDVRNKTNGLEQLEATGLKIVHQIEDHSIKCKRWLLEDAR